MSANQVMLTFAGDSSSLSTASSRATQSIQDTAAAAGKSAKDIESRIGALGAAAAGMSSAVDDAGSALSSLSDFQQRGAVRAAAQARAMSDFEQAALDAEQAAGDLAQAQVDLAQTGIDAQQAAEDGRQALLDQKQATLDARQAQVDYDEAVRAHGSTSIEAQQALIDLEQAQRDLQQADIDGQQATADLSQAQEDARQAVRDAEQAQRDAADATLDMADAQRELRPTDLQRWGASAEAAAGVVGGLVGVTNLLAMAHNAVSLSAIRATAATAAAKTATVAGTAATGIATAAQWLWNVALTANPIGLIIVAVAALVAGIVLIATKTTWFQAAWKFAWGGIKAAALAVWDWLKGLPSMVGTAFSKLATIITAPWRMAFNAIAALWNATVGKLSFSLPDWLPGIGGKGFSMPQIPKFHRGGVVPGAPGSEMLGILQAGETVVPANTSGGAVLEVRSGGTRLDDLLVEILARAVRVRGGDVQLVLGGGANG